MIVYAYSSLSLYGSMVKRPPGTASKQHTKKSYSGWSKRATRGYHSDYDDRSRKWEDSKPSDSTKDKEGQPRLRL